MDGGDLVMDGLMHRWVERCWMDGWMDGWMCLIAKWRERWVGGCALLMDGWMDGWMDVLNCNMERDRQRTRLNSCHIHESRMPSSD